jgi:hypothetical protein
MELVAACRVFSGNFCVRGIQLPRDMVTNLTPVTERDMLVSWGISEVEKWDKNNEYPDLRTRIKSGTLTDTDGDLVVRKIKNLRWALLGEIVDRKDIQWFEGDLATADIAKVLIMNGGWLWPPARSLPELLRRKPEIAHETLDMTQKFGLPVFLSMSANADIFKIDGTRRCTTFHKFIHTAPKSQRVFVGIWPNLKEYSWWLTSPNV